MIYAIYNNSYSRELVYEFCLNKDAIFINIGKYKHTDSQLTRIYKKSFFSVFEVIRLLKSTLKSEDEIILPNKNNILSNYLLFHFKRNIIHQVTEGSLNYHKREIRFDEIIKNYVKFILSLFFLKFYNPFFIDHVSNICRNNGIIISRNINHLYPSSDNVLQIKRKKIQYFNNKESGTTLIIGQQLNDGERLPKSLENDFLDLLNTYHLSIEKTFYLPHPKSLDSMSSDFNIYKNHITLLDNNMSAFEYVQELNPDNIIALGGSTLFLELYESQASNHCIAYGLKILMNSGFKRYERLHKFYKNLSVTIYS